MKPTQYIAAFLLVAMVALPAQAAVQQVRVLAVGIDGQSGVAEEKAIDYAKKRAVYLVARKMGVDQASAKIAALTDADFRDIVRGATVVRSRREDDVTYAEVNVSVIDTVLRRVLGVTDAQAFELTTAPPPLPKIAHGILVLPVLMQEGRPLLWEKENLMRGAMSDEVLRQAQGAVLVPAGDFDDLRLVDYQNVLEVSAQELAPMFERYGADQIVVAITSPAEPGSTQGASILLRRLSKEPTKVEVLNLPASQTPQSLEQQVALAAKALAGSLTQTATATSQTEQEAIARAEQVAVRFHYATMKELADMQTIVRGIKRVKALEIPTIALGDVEGIIAYTGTREELRVELIKKRILVTPVGEAWQLSLR